MSNSVNVNAGKPSVSGAIFVAPLSTALPTDATTAKNVAFVELGYVSEDGVTNSNSISSADIKAWGGDTVLSLINEKTDTWAFTLIESDNVNALKVAFGDSNVTADGSGNITVKANNKVQANREYIIEMIGQDGLARRVVLPNAAVTAVGDIVYKADQAIGYPITLTANLDSAGNTHYEYIQQSAS